MATRKQQRGYAKVNELRKKLRQAPDSVEQNIRPAMENAARAVMLDMVALTPAETGDAKSSMNYKISRDGMAALIGPHADKAEVARRFKRTYGKFGVSKTGVVASVATMQRIKEIGDVFYFRFLDSGTKGFNGSYTRGDGTKVTVNIPPMQALNIRERALDANSTYGKKELAFAIKKTLMQMSNGGDNG